MSEWAVCGLCGRVVYVTHLNRHGNCDNHPVRVNDTLIDDPHEMVIEDDENEENGDEDTPVPLSDEVMPHPPHFKD